jgi:hypothetical protein
VYLAEKTFLHSNLKYVHQWDTTESKDQNWWEITNISEIWHNIRIPWSSGVWLLIKKIPNKVEYPRYHCDWFYSSIIIICSILGIIFYIAVRHTKFALKKSYENKRKNENTTKMVKKLMSMSPFLRSDTRIMLEYMRIWEESGLFSVFKSRLESFEQPVSCKKETQILNQILKAGIIWCFGWYEMCTIDNEFKYRTTYHTMLV